MRAQWDEFQVSVMQASIARADSEFGMREREYLTNPFVVYFSDGFVA